MGLGDRFYLLKVGNRDAVWGDIGNLIKIEGVVVGGSGAQMILLLPDATELDSMAIARLTREQWSDFIRFSDDPQVFMGEDGQLGKIFHRKLRYGISGAVQQKVWIADGCKCMYCGRAMGIAPLTIDHFTPLELGGPNDETNYLSCCRACNKAKGSIDPVQWCEDRGLDYNDLVKYLRTRRLPQG